MDAWLKVLPQLLFMLAIFAVPGLLVALSLRFRVWDALGLSVPLSLGVLGVADVVSTHGGVAWGLPVLLATAAALIVSGLAWSVARAWWVRRRVQEGTNERSTSSEGERWGRRQHAVAIAATLGAAVVGAIVVARGIGSPNALNQSYDAAFHVNSIMEIAQFHVASPSFLAQLGYPSGTGGFYPPTFAAAGALLVMYGGVTPYVAGNVATIAIAALWPISISILVRRIARPTAFGYAVAMVGAVTIGLFPALLLVWGTLWPNTLSVLTVAPAVVLVARLVGVDRSGSGADDPHGRLDWWRCLIALALIAIGMVFVQPNAVFLVFYLGLPLLSWAIWRRYVPSGLTLRRRIGLIVAVVAVDLGVIAGVTWVARHISTIAVTGNFKTSLGESWWSALGQVLVLTTPLSHPNYAFALLALVGIIAAARSARGRYLIGGYLILVVMTVASAGVDSGLTRYFTGYWYNDPHRFFALLPLFVLPLSALGADVFRAMFRARLERRGRRVSSGAHGWLPTTATVAAMVVCLGIVALQAGLGTARISRTVVQNYSYKFDGIVSPGQLKMFKRLAHEVPANETIAGSPYEGEIYAGVMSGRDVVYPTFRRPLDPVSAYVALNFYRYQSDPAVCAAVQSLRIGVVVTAREYDPTNRNRANYSGFDNLALTPGLTEIDSGGGATAYRVGPCTTYRVPLGVGVSTGQDSMFAGLGKQVPFGVVMAGDPYQGEVWAGALSGIPVLYENFDRPTGRLEALVAKKFSEFQKNRAVCAAVKKLHIGVVVEGVGASTPPAWVAKAYAGFENLSSVPGLTVIATGGGATAYRVGDCKVSIRHHDKKLRIRR